MITFTKVQEQIYDSGKTYVEGACLSTDSKPTDVANGSILVEMDSGKIYMFNESATAWVEIQ